MVPVVPDPPDVLGDVEGRRDDLPESHAGHEAQLLVSRPGLVKTLLHVREKLPRDGGAVLVKGEIVAPDVPHVGGRVDSPRAAGEGVLVGPVGQSGVGAAGGDSLQLRLLGFGGIRGQGLVRVFDGPAIVRTDGGLPVLPLRFTFRRQVDRDVVHDRPGQPLARRQ